MAELLLDQECEEFLVLTSDYAHSNWHDYVMIEQLLFRPGEIHILKDDSSKAQANLGWRPTVDLRCLVAMMVEADLKTVRDSE